MITGRAFPHRRAAPRTERRLTAGVLASGSLLALASLLGPAWLSRSGVILAVTAAVASCLLAWRELALARREHAAELLAVARAHGRQLTAERRLQADVLDAVSGRLRSVTALAAGRQRVIARLERQVARLRAANAMLTRDRNIRDRRLAELRQTLRERDAELRQALRDRETELTQALGEREADPAASVSGVGGDVRVMVLRPASGRDTADPADTAYTPFPPDTAESEDCLAGMERRVVELSTGSAVTLPNYEDDRRFA